MNNSVTKFIQQRKPISSEAVFSDTIPPLLQRLYRNRGITHEQEIATDLSALLPFHSLRHIQKAAKLLAKGVQEQQKFLIIGDFDTDGATSTALAVKSLKAFGAKEVHYLIPNRFEYGYGLTPEIVDVAAQFKPDILITVDNGISSHDGVLQAKKYGMKVLITDHHLPAETLPAADVIINPNQPEDEFPSKNLAGVGVIFYVMLALRDYLNAKSINMAQFLDLVALGTVADVVPLDKNNRILVHHGLHRIRQERCSYGIIALLQSARRKLKSLTASDLGYAIAPRLNAAGRLEDMSLGVACLLSDSLSEAQPFAAELEQLNAQRKEIESDMTQQAEKILAPLEIHDPLSSSLCLYHPEFHQGVIGILAGRLKDRYHKPAVIFAKVNDTELKGSARSIPGLHLRDLLALIHTRHPDLILKFGGHAMAAGLSIDEKNFDQFSSLFNQTVLEILQPEYLQNILLTDGELTFEELSLSSAELLETQSVWGQGFPEPLFYGQFQIIHQTLLQNKHLKLKLKPVLSQSRTPSTSLPILDAICFNYPHQMSSSRIHMAYKLSVNEYLGSKKLQLIIEHLEYPQHILAD